LSQRYYRTVLSRVWQDTRRWGKEQVLVLLLAIATLALQIREGIVRSGDWKPSIIAMVGPYIIYAAIFLVYQFIRAQRLLFAEFQATSRTMEDSLRSIIAERDAALRNLTDKPKRTPAEQHDYETAKKVLQLVGGNGLTAMRHIRRHGTLIFGTYPPVLPQGLALQETLRVYDQCASEGLLTCNANTRNNERTFSIAPTMGKILDELLYEEESGLTGFTDIRRK
jgi:hypothetical protein